MKHRVPIITTCLIGAGLLAVATLVSVEQKTFAAEPPPDPAYTAHSAHVAAGASQAGGQPPVEAQLAELRTRIQQLEAIKQQQPGQTPAVGAMPMGAGNPPRMKPMPGVESGAKPMQGMAGMSGSPAVTDQLAELRSKVQRLETTLQRQSGSSSAAMPMGNQPRMSGMGAAGAPKPAGGMSGMGAAGGAASPPGGEMGMMAMKMDKMMGMMGKMMGGMGGGAKPAAAAPMAGGGMPMMDDDMMEMAAMAGGAKPAAGAPMAGGGMPMMDDDMMEMGGMGGGAKPAGAPMAGGGMPMMDDDMMEMAGMMGKMDGMGGMGAPAGKSAGKGRSGMSSALPGFPGASHLYHLGATGFFLDHRRHIALSTEQKAKLNQIKEQAALDKASASRSVQEAEQDLWTLTAAEQPDNEQIEAKVAEIEKIKGDARVRFISAVGDATKVLNEGQRMSLTGFAPPASAAPAAAPMPAAMSDM